MRYDLSNFIPDFDTLAGSFAKIKIPVTKIEFYGNFKSEIFGLNFSTVINALPYLPKHITTIKFDIDYIYTLDSYKKKVGTKHARAGDGGEINIYERRWYYNKDIGEALGDLISNLPKSCNHLILNFTNNLLQFETREYIRDHVCYQFYDLLKKIPPHISHLHISKYNYSIMQYQIKDIFSTNSIQNITGINFLLADEAETTVKQILQSINRSQLDLSANNLYKVPVLGITGGLSPNIRTLNLGFNEFNEYKSDDLCTLFLNLPPKLVSLSVIGNRLSSIKTENLAIALSGLPKMLNHIDLSENGLLLLDVKGVAIVLSGLQPNIHSIRITEKDLKGMSAANISLRLACLPKHCTSLSFSDSNFMGLSIAHFSEIVSRLTKSITTLDLSGLNLNQLAPKDLQLLLSKIPSTVTKLIVKRNHLNTLDPKVCKEAFSALHKNLTELDICENGIDRLYINQMNRLLNAFPDLLLLVEKDIGIRNDGVLTPLSGMGHHGLFKPQGRIRHQKESALKVLADVKYSKNEASKVMNIIFPFVPEEWAHTTNQVELAKTLIPSKNPAALKNSKAAVTYRIQSLPEGSDKLDLSCCDLDSVTNATELIEVFRLIPNPEVIYLSLRDNDFNKSDKTRAMFIAALAFIPRHIKYLDLSGNGFEQESAEQLEQLFKNLPPSISYVSLGHEKPISPEDQIAKRKWPNSYSRLTNDTDDIMQKARILLNDYTKNDSMFLRFLFLHWNRGYTNEVARLVRYIDNGAITNINDLLSEFDQINIVNETGSLRKRLAFLANDPLVKNTILFT